MGTGRDQDSFTGTERGFYLCFVKLSLPVTLLRNWKGCPPLWPPPQDGWCGRIQHSWFPSFLLFPSLSFSYDSFSEQNKFTAAWHGKTGKCERNIRASMLILQERNPRPRKMQWFVQCHMHWLQAKARIASRLQRRPWSGELTLPGAQLSSRATELVQATR